MCGIAGIYDGNHRPVDGNLVRAMTDALVHRGPDDCGVYQEGNVGLGMRRLSIIDLSNGNQPIYNEDHSVVAVCNGEIYNYRELRGLLQGKGHVFRTNCDVEVLVHLYEEYHVDFLNELNGQFAFAIFDRKNDTLLLARDHFGIAPLFYTMQRGTLVFASEIKAILRHPSVERKVNLAGLDQILSLPGNVSPTTMFAGIDSLRAGTYLLARAGVCRVKEYWDLDYPREADEEKHPEAYYVQELNDRLLKAVRYRLNADVPIGFFLSGGLDSSLIASVMRKLSPECQRDSFSITFGEAALDERKYQQLMARAVGSLHHEIEFNHADIAGRLKNAIYHAETPLKESYNTCSLALSEAVRSKNIKVVLTGEGADELFGGYVGYKFDKQRQQAGSEPGWYHEQALEEEVRETLWGDAGLVYEKDFTVFEETKRALYSKALNGLYSDFHCLRDGIVDKAKLHGRSKLHKRSYLDFKLRIADHLVSDHGDRMAYANSVEARYPFLDIDLVRLATRIPSGLKLHGMTEKYILKQVSRQYVPAEIIEREKFSFVAPGSSSLLRQNTEWINDLLAYDTIKRQGYFDPAAVERLKKCYCATGFTINQTFETDLLMIVITFGIFLDQFAMPDFA